MSPTKKNIEYLIARYENNRKGLHYRMSAPREQVLEFWWWVHGFRVLMQPKEETHEPHHHNE